MSCVKEADNNNNHDKGTRFEERYRPHCKVD